MNSKPQQEPISALKLTIVHKIKELIEASVITSPPAPCSQAVLISPQQLNFVFLMPENSLSPQEESPKADLTPQMAVNQQQEMATPIPPSQENGIKSETLAVVKLTSPQGLEQFKQFSSLFDESSQDAEQQSVELNPQIPPYSLVEIVLEQPKNGIYIPEPTQSLAISQNFASLLDIDENNTDDWQPNQPSLPPYSLVEKDIERAIVIPQATVNPYSQFASLIDYVESDNDNGFEITNQGAFIPPYSLIEIEESLIDEDIEESNQAFSHEIAEELSEEIMEEVLETVTLTETEAEALKTKIEEEIMEEIEDNPILSKEKIAELTQEVLEEVLENVQVSDEEVEALQEEIREELQESIGQQLPSAVIEQLAEEIIDEVKEVVTTLTSEQLADLKEEIIEEIKEESLSEAKDIEKLTQEVMEEIAEVLPLSVDDAQKLQNEIMEEINETLLDNEIRLTPSLENDMNAALNASGGSFEHTLSFDEQENVVAMLRRVEKRVELLSLQVEAFAKGLSLEQIADLLNAYQLKFNKLDRKIETLNKQIPYDVINQNLDNVFASLNEQNLLSQKLDQKMAQTAQNIQRALMDSGGEGVLRLFHEQGKRLIALEMKLTNLYTTTMDFSREEHIIQQLDKQDETIKNIENQLSTLQANQNVLSIGLLKEEKIQPWLLEMKEKTERLEKMVFNLQLQSNKAQNGDQLQAYIEENKTSLTVLMEAIHKLREKNASSTNQFDFEGAVAKQVELLQSIQNQVNNLSVQKVPARANEEMDEKRYKTIVETLDSNRTYIRQVEQIMNDFSSNYQNTNTDEINRGIQASCLYLARIEQTLKELSQMMGQ